MIALPLVGAACTGDDPSSQERPIPIGGAVVAWVGEGKTPEAVSVGLTLELRAKSAPPPDPAVLLPVLASAQRWVGSSFTDPAALFESRRTSPAGLMTAVSLEMRDPRYRVAAVKLPWIVRGTTVTMSPDLCPRAGQQMTLMSPGIYLCTPVAAPPRLAKVAAKDSGASGAKKNRPSTRSSR